MKVLRFKSLKFEMKTLNFFRLGKHFTQNFLLHTLLNKETHRET